MNCDAASLIRKYPDKKWELVLFVSPVCNSSCAHCWSYNTYLGKMVDLDWYANFFSKLNVDRIEQIKLSGGESTLYPQLPELLTLIRRFVPDYIPIHIFTNGRTLIPTDRNAMAIETAMQKILKLIGHNQNICLQISGDEHHAGSLWRAMNGILTPPILLEEIRRDNEMGQGYLKNMILNFLDSCEKISNDYKELKFTYKVKLHCEKGRLDFHRTQLYSDISDETWARCMVCSEGLIHAGNAEKLPDTVQLKTDENFLSLFVFPGAHFLSYPETKRDQAYHDVTGRVYYLSGSRKKEAGVVMFGWWNLIQQKHCALSVPDFLTILNDASGF